MAGIKAQIQSLEKVTECRCRPFDFENSDWFTIDAKMPNPGNKEIRVKFQTSAKHQDEPTVTIVCGDISKEQQDALLPKLDSIKNLNVFEQFERLRDEIASNKLFQKATSAEQTAPQPAKQNKQKKSSSVKKQEPTKKLRMRTAADVIKRIKWDDKLNEEHFIVGYIDRFIGIVEQAFGSFNWVNPAEAEWDDLNIPEHRIQYFKYMGKIVWDKNQRIDNIFGSTGGDSIYSLVDQQLSLLDAEPCAITGDSPSSQSDESDDDDVNVVLTDVKVTNPLSNTCSGTSAPSRLVERRRDCPNHFIAIPITNEGIRQSISDVQAECFAMSNVDLTPYMIATSNLHITLCALRIDNDNDLDTVSQCLYENVEEFNDKLKQEMIISGLDSFWSRVLYAQVQANDSLESFALALQKQLIDAGIKIYDEFTFVPHVTVLKLKNPKYCDVKFPIDQFITKKQHDNKNFGTQILDQVVLFSMLKDEQGLYGKPFYLDL